MIKKIVCGLLLTICVLFSASCKKDADYEVGILQLVTHGALDAATEGFKEAVLEELPEGKTVNFTVLNPEGDPTSMATMATKLVRESDLVMGNGTDAAIALKTAATNESLDTPILFTSVTDAVTANLVSSNEKPGGNVTGTSDLNPVSKQIDLIVDLYDGDKDITIGFLYTTSEVNSEVQVEAAKEYALEVGLSEDNLKVITVADQASITPTLTNAIDKIDALYIPTDNMLASNMGTVSNVTKPAGVPVICGEENMVKSGGLVTLSVNYKTLGITTGEMACDILFEGKTPTNMPVLMQDKVEDFTFVLNEEYLKDSKFVLSDDFKTKYSIK